MEIILLRHGKPKIDLKGNLNAAEFRQLAVEYAQSGIQDTPPEKLNKRFKSHYVVCSDLERSQQSAKSLGFKQVHLTDGLFTETNIPHFDKNFYKLPVTVWLILLRVMWLFGFEKNGESFAQAKKRSKQAAEKLIMLAQENEKVIVVGHGLINRLIANQLQKNGWQASGKTGKKYWEFGKYTFNC